MGLTWTSTHPTDATAQIAFGHAQNEAQDGAFHGRVTADGQCSNAGATEDSG